MTNPLDIAEAFNNVFVNSGAKLAKAIPTVSMHYTNYLKQPNPKSLALHLTSPAEICEIIHSLSNKKSFGYDKIPTLVVKHAALIIATHLSNLINYSFTYGFFSNDL